MGEAIENSLRYLTPGDTAALVAYLRTVPPRPGAPGAQINPAPPAMAASSPWAPGPGDAETLGKQIFEGACASCHQWNGAGQQTAYAALAGSKTVNDPAATNVAQAVIHGARLRTARDAAFMPAFGAAYTDREIAAVSNYVVGHFGGKAGHVTAAEVRRARAS
jgi:mono/diheme cytochrome c family protein